MSILQIPDIRRCWNPIVGNELFGNTMSVNKFEKIRQYLHFNDNAKMVQKTAITHDRIHKMRPLVNKLTQNFQKVPFEEFLCGDEQMCSTKARKYMKQYLPAKPHKWGYKFFVLCGASGYAYNFELYTGQENDDRFRLANEINLGASSNVVIRLVRNVSQDMNYRIYFDNYYTSTPLISELYKKDT